jgi:hypothetical protein
MQPDVKKLHDAAQALRQTDAFRDAMDNPQHPTPPIEPSEAQTVAQDAVSEMTLEQFQNLSSEQRQTMPVRESGKFYAQMALLNLNHNSMAQDSNSQTRPQTEAKNQDSSSLMKNERKATYSRLRLIFAWVVGFIVFMAVGVPLGLGGDMLGVPSSIHLSDATTITHGGGRFSYDEEVSSLQTFFGYMVGGVSFLVALWAGRATYFQSIGAGFTDVGRASFFAWLIALTTLLCLSLVYHLAFAKFDGPIAYYVQGLLGILTIFGVGWASHQWYKNRVASLRAQKSLKGIKSL